MTVGIWTFAFDGKKIGEVRTAAREVESLGFATLWFGEYRGREALTQAALLLEATTTLTVATGIARFSERSAAAAEAAGRTLAEAYPGRFTLGLGGHRPGGGGSAMQNYLDAMDAADLDVASDSRPRRLLAALGPRMLKLAATQADGAHTYFVPPEHTASARETMGPDAYLAAEQAVVLDTDPLRARRIAREHVAGYVRLAAHQRTNLRRLGYTEEDLADGGSDRLVDAIVAYRSEQEVTDRIRAHLDAGADHVCVQVLSDGPEIPVDGWRRLATLVP
ncbi:TIGR03620 family F420-dependent LLM class oxidoreductase [Amycolatopsis rubida]|uniref:TIGR03620 family F420-dependent LLM class oxidoreductase n=1 Tax=Amycolatopsis rubida TaxID=112413 RepID=A0ABX0BV80_9PSEU|nr:MULTISPECIES: TIGR03620 family F420-dependent LLM class oxidoreductase [Amycolatopsis]MYW92678.1 TIGR03620 family F420-dependent LLM class oxidoreductase [Amycolatopsis rubida]NEC57663.1 TIGR03620 family F420-dependent LLM class oxidoreductase [Amycolatopsis rubida]OAP24817.1 methylenetetrahydromethanopterin reductase [Amycolatopsis sp. M39]